MKKPQLRNTLYTFSTEIGEIRVKWEPNGPDEINGVAYKTTYKITVERDLLKGFKVEYQQWISRASASGTTAARFATRFIDSIKEATT